MAGEDPAFVRFVRTLPCAVCGAHGVEAHHAGTRGLGQRAHDSTCVPLCRQHHAAWHDAGPPFRGMSKDERQGWNEAAIAAARRAHVASLLDGPIPF